MVTESQPDRPVIEVRGVSKEFSGIYALRDVDLNIHAGHVNAIVGENGAGKSTLMKIISGVYTDYSGEIFYLGDPVRFSGPKEAQDRGVTIIHQELNLIPGMSVAENLFLGREPLTPIGLIDYELMNRTSRELLDRLHLRVHPSTPVYRLRTGQQQLVEIARALLLESKVLIMDEPTSALSDKEIDLLFNIIEDIRKKGVAVVYISHKLDELFRIADTFVALRDGKVTGGMKMKDASGDDIIRMMVGREVIPGLDRRQAVRGDELLRVSRLNFRNPLVAGQWLVKDVSFTLHKGEILGVSGLMGAGRTELLEALFGLHAGYVTADLSICGENVSIKSISDAIRAGMALVPEDRKLQGLILSMNVMENTSLASLPKLSSLGFLDRTRELELSRKFNEKLRVRLSSVYQNIETLSGGNQQKVVIAKWLATGPRILLLDEPTRGIDVGARQEIYGIIEKLASDGMGIIVVSSDLPEILSITDRIIVLSESRMTASFDREEATEESVMKAAIPRRISS
jgi:ribose transport system ATP-binding protein